MNRMAVDISLFRLINSYHHPYLDSFFTAFSHLGSGWIVIPILITLVILRSSRVKILVATLLIETAIVVFIKGALPVPRPAAMLENVRLLIPLHSGSFPSGDAAMASAIVAALWHRQRNFIRAILLFYAVAISYGRVYLGVHFPLDVVAGAMIGVSSARTSATQLIGIHRRKRTIS